MTFDQIQTKYTQLLKSYKGGYELDDKHYKLPLSDAIFCAEDVIRNKKFYKAITSHFSSITSNSTKVVDAGCGTGILGLYALISGAKRCIFVEQNPKTMKLCKYIIGQFGYTNQSEFILGNATNIRLKTKRDLLASETISSDCNTEDFHRIVNHLQQYKNKGGVTIPSSLKIILKGKDEISSVKYTTKIISAQKHIKPIPIPPNTKNISLSIGLTKSIRIKPGECMSLCGNPDGVTLLPTQQGEDEVKSFLFNTNIITMAGGGSGGHIRPIQSLIEYIDTNYHKQIHKIIRFGEKGSFENDIANELIGKIQNINLTFIPILAGKFRREKNLSALIKNIIDIIKLGIGFIQSMFYLYKHRVRIIFCKGGFVALPIIFASKILGKNLIVHESDTHPGLTNRIASKFTKHIFTGFANTLPNSTTIGQILSNNLIVKTDNSISNNKTTILITGGSLGSHSLYTAMKFIFKKLTDKNHENLQFIVVGGLLNKNISFKKYNNVETHIFATPEQMGEFYQQADICITRGGTTTLAESKLFNCKNIIIPIPRTHDQQDNAKYYQDNYGDIIISQNKTNFEQNLYKTIIKHINYKKKKTENNITKKIEHPKKVVIDKIIEYI